MLPSGDGMSKDSAAACDPSSTTAVQTKSCSGLHAPLNVWQLALHAQKTGSCDCQMRDKRRCDPARSAFAMPSRRVVCAPQAAITSSHGSTNARRLLAPTKPKPHAKPYPAKCRLPKATVDASHKTKAACLCVLTSPLTLASTVTPDLRRTRLQAVP